MSYLPRARCYVLPSLLLLLSYSSCGLFSRFEFEPASVELEILRSSHHQKTEPVSWQGSTRPLGTVPEVVDFLPEYLLDETLEFESAGNAAAGTTRMSADFTGQQLNGYGIWDFVVCVGQVTPDECPTLESLCLGSFALEERCRNVVPASPPQRPGVSVCRGIGLYDREGLAIPGPPLTGVTGGDVLLNASLKVAEGEGACYLEEFTDLEGRDGEIAGTSCESCTAVSGRPRVPLGQPLEISVTIRRQGPGFTDAGVESPDQAFRVVAYRPPEGAVAFADQNKQEEGALVLAGEEPSEATPLVLTREIRDDDETIVTFDFLTAGMEPGRHTLQFALLPLAGEEDLDNNLAAVTVNLRPTF